MATCRDIVTKALRQSGVIGLNEAPTASEADHGLSILQSYYDALFKAGPLHPSFRKFTEVDYTAGESEHITANETGMVVTIPDTITDIETNEERAPKELASVVVATGGDETNFVYSRGAWQAASNLTLGGDAPLSGRDMMGLASDVAMYFAEVFEKPTGPMLADMALRFRAGLIYNEGVRWLDECGRDAGAADFY